MIVTCKQLTNILCANINGPRTNCMNGWCSELAKSFRAAPRIVAWSWSMAAEPDVASPAWEAALQDARNVLSDLDESELAGAQLREGKPNFRLLVSRCQRDNTCSLTIYA